MIVVDTGPLVALADRDDADHATCVRWFDEVTVPLLVPSLVVTEVCYLLSQTCGPKVEAAFVRSLIKEPFHLVPLQASDFRRAAELAEQYADMPIGVVGAYVVAIAERLRVTTVATLDRRHFSIVRTRNGAALNLVP